MKITYNAAIPRSVKSDALVVFVPEGKTVFNDALIPLRKIFGARLSRILSLEGFTGKADSLCMFLSEGRISTPRICLVGLGGIDDVTTERFRRASALAVRTAGSRKLKKLSFLLPDIPLDRGGEENNPAIIPGALAEGAVLGTYSFDRYKTGKSVNKSSLSEVIITGGERKAVSLVRKALHEKQVICDAVCLARDLQNSPGNDLYPETLADIARKSGTKHKYRVTVWDEKRLRQTGFGGLLAVSAGSDRPARFIIMELNAGRKGLETIVLVGKGVTFDAGGISIKPASGMGEMKMDMSGAAAVIATMEAAARLKLDFHLVGLVPATENLLGGSSMRPGDIITHYGGKTSEVDNTDAEGRLILADALTYASTFSPAAVIDLATLTGACVVALGHHASGMMGNDEDLMAQLKGAGERTFERVWPLPLYEEYEKLIVSDVADVKNIGGRWAGAITAALFLKKFIGKYPWVHLDIAGTAMLDADHPYSRRGGSGVGVRLLVEFLKNRR
jgi:leucyl aminopeptidase